MSDRTIILTIFLFLITTTNLYAQKNELWGMTSGQYSEGTIFKTDSAGNNIELVYAFGNEGFNPYRTRFTQYTNGNMYAVINNSKYQVGAIFEFNPYSGIYTVKHYFSGQPDGAYPVGAMLLANNSMFYGMCTSGGDYNHGIIYEFDPKNEKYKVIYSFKDTISGMVPIGSLIQATNGKLYGVTLINQYVNNSSYGGGTLFEYDLATDSLTTKVYFSHSTAPGVNNGRRPAGDLVQINNGHLFGMTTYGGTSYGGVIFDYDIQLDTLIVRHNFTDTLYSTAKLNPEGSLIQAANGKLYGFTKVTLFEFNPTTNQYITKVYLESTTDVGIYPSDRLLEVSTGKLYGVCSAGGSHNKGVIFEYNIQNNQCIKKVDFDGVSKGAAPTGGLILSANGILYGMTANGGVNNKGVIFDYNYLYTQIFSKDYDFKGAVDGEVPTGGLLLASNGKFYGMTSKGGVYDKGVIFEYNPGTFSYEKKFDFNDTLGASPLGSFIEASNGKLYATTQLGGNYNGGILFEYNMGADSITVIRSFSSLYGLEPYGDLIEVSPTKLFGLTSSGFGWKGSVYEYDIALDTMKAYPLNYNIGYRPTGSFIQYDSTTLYALTKYGGVSGYGTLLKFDLSNDSISVGTIFTGPNGSSPSGSLCKTTNGRVFGLTNGGGVYGSGVLFEYAYGSIVKKKDFNYQTNGGFPQSTLMQASNGKLYGMTRVSGTYYKGTLFEYDISTNVLTVKHNFKLKYGTYPMYSKLVERDACGNATYSSFTTLACNSYTSPSGKIWTQSGLYKDTLSNRFYCDSIITINLIVSHVDTSVSLSGATLSANFNGGSYQWLDCDNAFTPIMGATAQSFTPSANGHYAVMVAGNGCVDTSGCYAVTKVGIIENTFGDGLQAFPNPTSGEFSIDLGKDYKEVQLWLRDATGHLVNHSEYRNCNRIDYTIDAPTGLYFLELRNSKGNRVLIKIMKL